MADFGPTSVTKSIAPSEFSYNGPLLLAPMREDTSDNSTLHLDGQVKGNSSCSSLKDFKDNRNENNQSPQDIVFKTSASNSDRNLDDSKDSDEGFSSSFSPTSEPQMLQDQITTTSSVYWGPTNSTKDDFLVPGFPMSGSVAPLVQNTNIAPVSVNSPFGTNNNSSRRVLTPSTAPSFSPNQLSQQGLQKRPVPALSTFLATNKAMANALGVSGWAVNPTPAPVSSQWPNQVSTNNFNQSSWSVQHNRPNIPFPMNVNNHHRSFNNKPSMFPVSSPQSQVKNLKNRSTMPSAINSTSSSSKSLSPFGGGSNLQINSINGPTGLDMTIVDDITQLTNTFSNLTTSGEGTSNTSNGLFSNQERQEVLKYSSLEPRLLDIIRSPLDPPDHLQAFRYQLQKKGFPHSREDQIVPSLNSSLNGSPRSDLDLSLERYSRKVFVGGLPPDIDEDEIHASFCRFGHLSVDWPHKAESKSYFPPKGYAFLLYKEEIYVQRLIDSCMIQDGKLYLCVSSPTIKDKPVQIRPWNLGDADFVMDGSQPLDPRKTIFVGGVPRPLRAVELAMIMDRLYGGVCYAGIDVDPELKYPKGAGRVAFSNQQSYIAAISARFIQLQHGDIDKRVEVKPYVLDDQMCDECHGVRCNGKFAPFFCSNITCLQYYCEQCWAIIHSRPGREFHKPLVKEGGDRPRQPPMSFRW